MYPPLTLNGLNTSPGFPGTGLATGNCATFSDFGNGDSLAEDLFAATRDVPRVDGVFREAIRVVGVGEGTATGWPGLVTSEVFAVGSDSPKTYLTGAVTMRPIPQPTKPAAINASANVLAIMVLLYRPVFFNATNRRQTAQCRHRL